MSIPLAITPIESNHLEKRQRFSRSLLWQLQRDYFNQQGIQAWNGGSVPHYVTSNPFIANAYGKVIRGYLRDCDRLQALDLNQPVYIIELGAGSGRFAYHFLKQFWEWYPHSVLRHIPVTYVMTDLAQKNLDFWQAHPFLRPFVDEGLLDFARFDVADCETSQTQQSPNLTLLNQGETLSVDTLHNPLIAIANYFFDSLPNDLFYVEDSTLFETLVTLTPRSSTAIASNPKLSQLHTTYTNAKATAAGYYDDPVMNQLLHTYQTGFHHTHILFPTVGLAAINALRKLSGDRLLLLSSDKGHTCDADLQRQGVPEPASHGGAFSLMVNYHAIAQYTIAQGGQALMPDHLRRSITICGFLFGDCSDGDSSEDDWENCIETYIETHQAYWDEILQASPDDFFALKKAIEPHFDTLTLKQILAYLRLSHWDHQLFLGCFDNLMCQVESAPARLCQEVYHAIQNIWQTYYFMGEEQDLPFHCAMLLYKMGDYHEAIAYLDISLQFYGEDPGIRYNQAKCYVALEALDKAWASIEKALSVYPEFAAAQALRTELAKGLAKK
ncbi:MAG: tetratricopeptide repeat protein [Cyanobacteria bacterium P01_F01_bin.150]